MADEQAAHVRAYVELAGYTLSRLVKIDTGEEAQAFVPRTAQQIREIASKIPGFHMGEFIEILKAAVKDRGHKETEDCRRAVDEAKTEAEKVSAELTERLRRAQAAGDDAAQHIVWRDREIYQEAGQAKINAATKRIALLNIQLDAFKSLASALGVTFPGSAVNSKTSRKTASSSATKTKATPSPDARNSPLRLPSSTPNDLLAELNGLIGLAPVKADVRQLIDMARVERMRQAAGLPISQVSRHLVFLGNPGTGKTTVARLLARLYAEIGVLRTGQLVEVTRSDLVAGYIGQTAIKTTEAVKRALGGILFIDEAYSLFRSTRSGQDYGQEAIDTLVKMMEDHRDELIVIVAGYSDEMHEFIKSNPGLPSRFPRTIQFPDYSTDELVSIFESMCSHDKYEISAETIRTLRQRLEGLPRTREFGNGRLVRNIFEAAITRQASRIIATKSSDLTQLLPADLG